MEMRNNEDLLCFKGWKGKVARPIWAWSLRMGNIQKFGVCRARQPDKIRYNPLGDWLFGERSYKGLKVSTNSCNPGNLSKGQPRPSWAQAWVRDVLPLQTSGSHAEELWQQCLKARAGPVPQPRGTEQQRFSHWPWKSGWPLFWDYVSIWDFGQITGRVTVPRQRCWTSCSSHNLWNHGNLSHLFCVKKLNMTIFVPSVSGYYIQDMCKREQFENRCFHHQPKIESWWRGWSQASVLMVLRVTESKTNSRNLLIRILCL